MRDQDKMTEKKEHILVCISPAPSNQKVISAAARMAEAFHAPLTAIYVRPTNDVDLPESDRQRLQNSIQYAQQCGASFTTIIGDDVPVQIAEYAHISGATKIVVGRSGTRRRHFWSKAALTEQIILNAPDVDVYIIPDSATDIKQHRERIHLPEHFRISPKDVLMTILLLAASTGIGLIFTSLGFSEANIITVFILGVLIISVITVNYICSAAGSLASVLLFNWFFIEPRFSFHTYETEYAITFGIMLISSLITGSLAHRLIENAKQSAQEAFRAKVLFDTNQLLQKAADADEAIRITARQIKTLLDRNVIIYPENSRMESGSSAENGPDRSDGQADGILTESPNRMIIDWVFANQLPAGAYLDEFENTDAQYHPICLNGHCYGVVCIYLDGKPLESFEYSVLMAILGESALTLESLRNAAEKEQAFLIAHNEQLRSNLLRSISHDIRTPLTSISGNASNLMMHYRQLDEETLMQTFSDIYDDSEWLIDLVENLLFISRIENGRMQISPSTNVINEVIEESIKHLDKNADQHHIVVENSEELLLARADTRLIMQVLINLVNNAIKNTPKGSEIRIRSERRGENVVVSVSDNGPGIPDELKPHVFEMFYTGQNTVVDGRRGLGLGLPLCKSIIEAHNGRISLVDNVPTGCCFVFTLPSEEVQINE